MWSGFVAGSTFHWTNNHRATPSDCSNAFCDKDFGLLRTRVEISVTFLKSQAGLSGGKN